MTSPIVVVAYLLGLATIPVGLLAALGIKLMIHGRPPLNDDDWMRTPETPRSNLRYFVRARALTHSR